MIGFLLGVVVGIVLTVLTIVGLIFREDWARYSKEE
jgi:hypothetical protein